MIGNIFDINNIFFTVLNYQMSYLEFFGTVFTAAAVYLAARNKTINWPIGIVGVILYGFLFYQIQLYSDLIEQIYYLVTGFWGWWLWTHPKSNEETNENNELIITGNTKRENLIYGVLIILSSVGLGYFISNVHTILPGIFNKQATFPYIDAVTTVMSFIANFLLMKRKIETWYLWIVVDIVGVWLYFVKGTALLSILYFAFLINAVFGYLKWRREVESYAKT